LTVVLPPPPRTARTRGVRVSCPGLNGFIRARGRLSVNAVAIVAAAAAAVTACGGAQNFPTITAVATTTSPVPSNSAAPTSPSPTITFQNGHADSLKLPVRALFYYPWFPQAWNQQGLNPFTHYQPSAGPYDSSDPATVSRQIVAMQYGGLQAGIASWWGQGSYEDGRIPLLLQQANGTTFKWALYYEAEGNAIDRVTGSPNPTVAQLSSDLSYISQQYANNVSYLHVDNRPVIFAYGDGSDNCSMAARWAQANTFGFYVVLKVFSGYMSCPSQPNAWHQYGPAVAEDSQSGQSFTISPGFYKANDASPRLARDPNRFAQNVRDMVASLAPWQLVTTFNEWGEGSACESAVEWQSSSGYGTYLDILHGILVH
jgi:hypothetical protein